jgi:hypothetical protein
MNMSKSSPADVFIYLLSSVGKKGRTNKVVSYYGMHAFLKDKNTLVVSMESEGCAVLALDELLTDCTYERLCIHLVVSGFRSPVVELLSSAVFDAIYWLHPDKKPAMLPAPTELVSIESTETTTQTQTIDI